MELDLECIPASAHAPGLCDASVLVNIGKSEVWCVLQDEFRFYCQNCSQTGYKPFELNNASGLPLMVRHTNYEYSKVP